MESPNTQAALGTGISGGQGSPLTNFQTPRGAHRGQCASLSVIAQLVGRLVAI